MTSLLEHATKKVNRIRKPRWMLSLYPEAGEAGGVFSRPGTPKDEEQEPQEIKEPDKQRAQEEAARRAKGKLRRYCAANKLNRLGTLTYANACHEPEALRTDLHRFFRGLRRNLGGDPLPYVWVPEWHRSGHGLHAHFALGKYVPHALIERTWRRGFVHIKLLGDDIEQVAGALGAARIAARYLAKYVGKDFGQDDASGLHRYEVARGFQPRVVPIQAGTPLAVLRMACEVMGSAPQHIWRGTAGGHPAAPPALWAVWG